MADPQPTIYDAPEAYRREELRRQVPGNTPAHVMQRYKAGIMDALMNDTKGLISGYSVRVANWGTYDLEARMKECDKIKDVEEIRILLSVENDNQVLARLVDRKRVLDEEA